MKKTFAVKAAAAVTTGAMIFMNVAVAFAGTIPSGMAAYCSNTTTQEESTNFCQNLLKYQVEIANDNDADINNEITQKAETGENEIKSVNGNVSYTSGDITASTEVTTKVNYNETTVDFGGGDVTLTGSNSITGEDSENTSLNEFEYGVNIENDNDLDLDNIIETSYSTGENEIESVNGDVDGVSGDVDSKNTVTNEANKNKTEVKGPGDVTITSGNKTTQSDSENISMSELEVNFEIENENEADIYNWFMADVETGNNELKEVNGDVTSWDSGNIGLSSEITNGMINSNDTSIESWFDDIEIVTNNEETQSDSENEAVASVEIEIEIENNNDLDDLDNFVMFFAGSGDNELKDINGDVDSTTGTIDLDSIIENEANFNTTEFSGAGDVSATAWNHMTQSDSDNFAMSEVELELEVENNNDGDITNEADMIGLSGGNEGEEINGNVGLDTGDVTLGSAMSTDANYSTTNVDQGIGEATEEAYNEETQSNSENTAINSLEHEENVENDNELDLSNDDFQFGATGDNEFSSVNGNAEFGTGAVEETTDLSATGNESVTNL